MKTSTSVALSFIFWAATCGSFLFMGHKFERDDVAFNQGAVYVDMNLYYSQDVAARISHYVFGHDVPRILCPECLELNDKSNLNYQYHEH